MSDIEALLNRPDAELFAELGRAISSHEDHAAPATNEALAERGQGWLRGNLSKIRSTICGNQAVNALRDKSDVVTLASTVADVLLKLLGIPVPSIVAVLVLRIGLNRLCDEPAGT